MPFCSYAEGAGIYDVTPIENIFLLEYLPSVPEGFLRVYLYARMLSLHPEMGDGLEDMARALRMDEDAVRTAMDWWERQGLMQRLTDRPPTYAIIPMRVASVAPMEKDYYEYRDFNANLQALFGADNLLHPKQYEMANDWLNLMGFTQDAVLKMVEDKLKHSRSKKPDLANFFNRLNETAAQWAERGVRTAEDVERALAYDEQVDKTAAAVMKRLSMRRPATADEQKLVAKWLYEWEFSRDEIVDACTETTKSRTPTLAYLDAILENRRKGDKDRFEEFKGVLKELGAETQPTPDQMERYKHFLEQGFEPETIRLAAVQCSRKKKHRFEELEWMLKKWADAKLFRFEMADAYVRDMSRLADEVRALLERCGTERRPQMDDIALYEEWRAAWPKEIIDYAAQCARGMQLPMRYMDKLLGEWRRNGVSTLEAAQAQHTAHAARQTGGNAPVNPALNYEQRTYSESDFDDLFVDLNSPQGGDLA